MRIITVSEPLEGKLSGVNNELSSQLLKYVEIIHASSKSAFSVMENLMQWSKAQIQALAAIHSLSKYGYKVLQAETGVEAIKLSERNSEIDLILMDIDLGDGMNGTDAAKRILTNRDLPLIFLSNHSIA